jgi:hypothetical protein
MREHVNYVIILNHSPEWNGLIEPLMKALCKSDKNIQILWESDLAKNIFKNDKRFNNYKVRVIKSESSLSLKEETTPQGYVFSAEVDRWNNWRVKNPSIIEMYTYYKNVKKFILKHYQENKKWVFIYEKPSTALSFILLDLQEENVNISYAGLSPARIPGFTEIHASFLYKKKVEFKNTKRVARSTVENKTPEYATHNGNRAKLLGYLTLNKFRRFFFSFKYGRTSFQLQNATAAYLGFVVNRVLRIIKKKLIQYDKVVLNNKYVVFPLHYHPEASTSLYAWWVPDELSLLTIIRRALPVDFQIIVKPHPNAIGQNYRLLNNIRKKIPGTLVIDPDTSNDTILKNEKCKLLITINSTMLLDAIKNKVPSAYFGSGPFPNTQYCKQVNSTENLYKEFQIVGASTVPETAYDDIIEDYIDSCENFSLYDDNSLDSAVDFFNNYKGGA